MGSVTSLNKEQNQTRFAQLPVDWYLHPDVYALEQTHLFSLLPQYLGHERMVPNPGDYRALDWMHNATALVNQHGQPQLISNICRHRQAVMLNGQGNTQHIVCPLHRWTYDLNGQLLGAPHFEQNPCLHLEKQALTAWQGLLFKGSDTASKQKGLDIAQLLKQLGCKQDFDFTGYHFESAIVDHYDFNWKTFIEVYLEDYHVGPFHPGLNQFVDCGELNWEFAEHYSVQTVGYKPLPDYSLSPVYKQWQQAVTDYQQGTPPKYGAIWFVLYPFLMIEWYPNVLVVSHIIPTGTESCQNVVEFYYPEDIALFEREYIKAQQAAYFETAVEDKEICQRMQDGRKGLFMLGKDERGPYQHPMETGLEHFHRWYRRQMEAHLPEHLQR
ncbi:aromatic ring-hydroxylating dioxygenase subunit alpha [Methylophilus sp. OH31]|uniref:aromatic ring-hydroxylating oxygenase subunit alpha n=1 Tax=Methylophilus sp. OH31 TaxID=1387312 RepID=UPI00046388A4|nr:aromatic ring-hydroxylating dioxygenase subunit alpha [Methylophilus sp. OH31]